LPPRAAPIGPSLRAPRAGQPPGALKQNRTQ